VISSSELWGVERGMVVLGVKKPKFRIIPISGSCSTCFLRLVYIHTYITFSAKINGYTVEHFRWEL
jgi:hypothetical protein